MRFISRKNRDKVQKCHTFCFMNVLFHEPLILSLQQLIERHGLISTSFLNYIPSDVITAYSEFLHPI